VVVIAFQDDVKDGFTKVKEDILDLKRSVNRELLAIDEVSNRLQRVVLKDEFYNFIKRLGERLDKIETSLEEYSSYEDNQKEVESKIKNLGKKISRQEDLSSEIKEVRKLRGKLAELEGSVVNTEKFNSDLRGLQNSISSMKKSALTGKEFENAKAELVRVSEKIEKVELESGKKLEQIESGLKTEVETLKGTLVEKETFDKNIKSLKKDISSVRNVLDSSVSEVDLSDYVTKKELGKDISKIDYITAEASKLSQKISDVGGNGRILQ